MKRGFKMCKYIGCPELVENNGYCQKHIKHEKLDIRERFNILNERKTTEQKRFYSSTAWTQTSIDHRKKEPICRKCKEQGHIEYRNLAVHHNPSFEFLIKNGLNPLADEYLETICVKHHQEELRKKNWK